VNIVIKMKINLGTYNASIIYFANILLELRCDLFKVVIFF